MKLTSLPVLTLQRRKSVSERPAAMPQRSCRAAGFAAVFEFGETRRLFDLGGEALAFKPRYNVQPAQYMPVILPGRKSWPRLRPQPIACQGGWPMPRPKGPAETTAYLSLQNLSTAESSAYTKLMHASSNRRKQKGEGIDEGYYRRGSRHSAID